MLAIGIDPGMKGAIVAYAYGPNGCNQYISATMMPMQGKFPHGREVANFIEAHAYNNGAVLAVLEKVGVMPGQGSVGGFNFGKGVGVLMGVLEVLKVPYIEVTPQAWKKVILAGTDRSKDATVAFVERRFPTLSLIPPGKRVKQDGIADAACLALYGAKGV